jgi:alkanesulfonate monooxygenase SsuD/methylene tetrahydromethanopterin reductase-like flavin-dependent oxidoreductase (luciferase family)
MDVDIILDPEMSPQAIAELAVEAERMGIRALWSSNYHQYWDCFISLVPAAMATSKILLGPLAISPWEMHPLKMANALLSLNEVANGRAMIAPGGGGGILGAIGWKASAQGEPWPGRHPVKKTRYPDRRVRGVRECLQVLHLASSGKLSMGYPGEIFDINRPFQMAWAKADAPLIYSCSSGPQMIRMGGQYADGIQVSDFTVDMMPEALDNLAVGFERRGDKPTDFRLGNFWAWHVKTDRDVSLWEARRELIWRGAVIGKEEHILRKFCHDDDEVQLIMDNWENFRKAFWTRSGEIEGVPADLVSRLIAGLSSAGGLDALDQEIERYQNFAKAGLTELSLRVHDEPMEALKLIGEHIVPAVQ